MFVVPGQRPRTVAIAPQAGTEAPIGLIKKDSTKASLLKASSRRVGHPKLKGCYAVALGPKVYPKSSPPTLGWLPQAERLLCSHLLAPKSTQG